MQLRQRAATAALLDHAAADNASSEPQATRQTFLGGSRQALVDAVGAVADPAPTRKVVNFRRGTARRLEDKARSAARGLWVGHSAGGPKLRMGGGVGVRTATTSLAATQARQIVSRLWRRGRIAAASSCQEEPCGNAGSSTDHVVLKVVPSSASASGSASGSASAPAASRYNAMDPAAVARAHALVVNSLNDLDEHGHDDSRVLFAWLHVIAQGKSVQAADDQANTKTMQYLAASRLVRAKVHFAKAFRTSHPTLAVAFARLCQATASNWTVEKHLATGVTKIADLSGLQAFLRRVRRVDKAERYGRYSRDAAIPSMTTT